MLPPIERAKRARAARKAYFTRLALKLSPARALPELETNPNG